MDKVVSFCFLLSTFFIACVPLPPGQTGGLLQERGITETSFPGLDPGGYQEQSLHFKINAYGSDNAKKISQSAEDDYNRIMRDTGLYSFMPRGLYQITVYSNHEEYLRKTGQAEWSSGVTVGNAIYSFESPALNGVLAHEMTHLIFYEFLGSSTQDLRWLNEGLAVYEELKAGPIPAPSAGLAPIPFDQMIHLVPATERERLVSQWYLQAGQVVQFMMEQGGHLGFSQFLTYLKSGRSVEEALGPAYPGLWPDLRSLEKAWLLSKGL